MPPIAPEARPRFPRPSTGHLDHLSFFTPLNHLGIQQTRRGEAPGGGIPSPLPLALGLTPFPISMQQGGGITRPLVAGKKRDTLVSHLHAIQEQVRLGMRALAHDERHHQSPRRRKGDPHPGHRHSFAPLPRRRQMVVLGADKAPQFVQLAFGHWQVPPMTQYDQATMLLSGPVQLGTDRIFVDLDDPCRTLDGISLRQGAHRQLKKGRIGFEIKIGGSVGQGHSPPARTTQRLLFPVTGTIFDQQPLTKGPTVVVTGTIGAVERFPLHEIPSQ